MTVKKMGRAALRLAFLVVVFALYVYGAGQQSRLQNQDQGRSDQSAYMGYAQALRERGYVFIPDRNRMPLYPALQSLLWRPGMSSDEFFERGKRLNVALSIVVLLALYGVFRRYLSEHAAANLLLITAFSLFVVKAPYFQSELLFYGLNFGVFVLTLEMLRRPTWRRALATGALYALAHLVKASVLPGLLLLVLWAWGEAAVEGWRAWREAREGNALTMARKPGHARRAGRAFWRTAGPAALVGLVFVAVLSPYLLTSKRVYGRYFYNVNSTFYMWYDSWAEVREGTRAHGDRLGWPTMPAEEIPSFGKYVREHTLRQMAERIAAGAARMLGDAAYVGKFAYGYFAYLLLYSLAVVAAALLTWRRTWALVRQRPFLALYLLSYFAAYGLLYTWFMPIGRGNRFVLGQFVPYLFTASLFLAQPAVEALRVRVGRRSIRSVDLWNGLVSVLLVPHIYYILTTVVRIADGGN